MLVLVNEPTFSLEVKKSRFIALARKCDTLIRAKDLVRETRKQYGDASHVVHAAVVGKDGALFSSSDDREPKNTAGRPALEVVKGSGITNVCVLIVRYFGGTLLGTGGLVQAYGDSAKGVLALAKTEELVPKCAFDITTDYRQYEAVKRLLEEKGCTVEEESFLTEVRIRGTIAAPLARETEEEIRDLSGARALTRFTAIE